MATDQRYGTGTRWASARGRNRVSFLRRSQVDQEIDPRTEELRRPARYVSLIKTRSLGSPSAILDCHPDRIDAVIAVLFAALASLWLWLEWPPERFPNAPWVAALGLVQCLPLAWRRRYPAGVLLAVTAGTILYGLAGGANTPWTANAWLLAAYTLGV